MTRRIDAAMQRVATTKMQTLLVDVANIVSPGTSTGEVEIEPF
jgi:hypothetical protein